MGADLLLATCVFDIEDKAELLRRIDALDGPSLRWLALEYGDLYLDVDEPDGPEIAAEIERANEQVRQELTYAVELVFGGSREIAQFEIGGQVWLVTGGMSGGDDPTDAYRYVALLAESGVMVGPVPRVPASQFVIDGVQDTWVRWRELPLWVQARLGPGEEGEDAA